MHPFPTPPRQVLIGDPAAFVGVTPQAILHYHQLGLLPERERGNDVRRRYGHGEILRLLWIRRMADAGIALDDIRDAFDSAAHADLEGEEEVAGTLAQMDDTLAAQETDIQRKRASVQRMRPLGTRLGLLDDPVSDRLEAAPEGTLREDDLNVLLVAERIFGPPGAAIQAGRFLTLATHPALRAECDRIDATEEAPDDTVAVDDPRVAHVEAERHAFETTLMSLMEESGHGEKDDAIFDAWDELHPQEDSASTRDPDSAKGSRALRAAEIIRKMPYDFSPARRRCMELAVQLGTEAATT